MERPKKKLRARINGTHANGNTRNKGKEPLRDSSSSISSTTTNGNDDSSNGTNEIESDGITLGGLPEGLVYLRNFLTEEEGEELLRHIDNEAWLSDLKRRVQHYGYKYDYKTRKINNSMHLGALPSFFSPIIARLLAQGILATPPDQVIVNEYLPGQGISPHLDKVELFEDHIVSISLNSPCVMEFKHKRTGAVHHQLLETCSLLLLKGPARYQWTHAIPARRKDEWLGESIVRKRRVSVTFRKVILHSN
jgi:alkylated DNA repair dioxygenase AlkB